MELNVFSVWVQNSASKGWTYEQMQQLGSAFLLRHKMLNFIQHLQYYMMIEVIDSYWTEFELSLKEVSDLCPLADCKLTAKAKQR